MIRKRIASIGDTASVDGTGIRGKITHIVEGDQDDPTKYKIDGRYWNETSLENIEREEKTEAKDDNVERIKTSYGSSVYTVYEERGRGDDTYLTPIKTTTLKSYADDYANRMREKGMKVKVVEKVKAGEESVEKKT